MEHLVEYSVEGHVATIRLNRPEKRNAFDAIWCALYPPPCAGSTRIKPHASQCLSEREKPSQAALTSRPGNAGAGKNSSAWGAPKSLTAHSADLFTRSVRWNR